MSASMRASTRSVLASSADGLGEPARTQRIDDGDLEPAGVEAAMRRAVELARGLHHHEGDIVRA